MKALVTGGAGYIGAHMAQHLVDAGHRVLVLDNLETGHADAVPKEADLLKADLRKPGPWQERLRAWEPEACFHFAARSIVSDSCLSPWDYLAGNSQMLLNLIEALDSKRCLFIYSSSCSVYGPSAHIPIREAASPRPESPYALSKRIGEQMIEAASSQLGFRAVALRYFNVAGCLNSTLRERHDPETHLIPNLLKAAMDGAPFSLYGTDHPTPDGTAIRDYVHVCDLVSAHLVSAQRLQAMPSGFFDVFNLGTGRGYSVREVISRVEALTGTRIEAQAQAARPGDAPKLVADNSKWMNWSGLPFQWQDLDAMISSALDACRT